MGLKSHRRSHERAARLSLPHLAPLGQSRGLGGRDRKKNRKSQKNMKRIPRLIFLTLAFGLVVGVGAPAQAADKKPNILFIMGDDIGWMQPSCYHRGLMVGETPNIDRIASEGAIMMHYYAEQSCTAGRTAFFTGMHPLRVGMIPPQLPGSPTYLLR